MRDESVVMSSTWRLRGASGVEGTAGAGGCVVGGCVVGGAIGGMIFNKKYEE